MSTISSLTSNMAATLFARMDSENQGYIDKSQFEDSFSNTSTGKTSGNTPQTIDFSQIFATLDTDSDGKVTESEFSAGLQNIADQVDEQLGQLRMDQAMGQMPPPPPGPPSSSGEESTSSSISSLSGFSQDELEQQLAELTASGSNNTADTHRASLISSIVSNFSTADTDGNGKVSNAEAMAYAQANNLGPDEKVSSISASSSSGTDSSTTSSTSTSDSELKLMLSILLLAQSYGTFGSSLLLDTDTSSISTEA